MNNQMSFNEIYINPIQKEDISQVAEIASDAYGRHHWSKEAFYTELDNKIAKYYAARIPTGEIAGYAGSWHIVDEAHITTIAVCKNRQRQHIAECLIVKLLEDCYNNYIKYITLEVRVSNIPAIKLYEKYGFKSLGTRKGYYQDNNEDALIMWTENIFSEEYKEMFYKNVKNLEKKIQIK
ncbi:MAG: ribosomal protein S18-alanine N-acetyltransferase [Candidatus Gastranaerophilales bacterium]|nr:ribosomal protein S18-alanine N-acetyltransferase [Candidatus Gastranaerophilales bacterium]